MKKLLLETSFSKIYMIVMILITLLVLGGCFSYAIFSVSKEKGNAISIVTGNLTYKLTVDNVESNKLVVGAGETKEFIVTLSNPNNRKARFNFYYTSTLEEGINAWYIEKTNYNTPPREGGINLQKSGTSGSSNIYLIKVVNRTGSNITINLGVSVGLDYNDLTLPSKGHLFEEYQGEPVADIVLDPGDNGSTFDDGVDTFITGKEPNNYIWYSGKLWRAVSVNNDAKTTKIVSEWNISAIPYNEEDNTAFEGSYMKEWLNDTSVDGFLYNLRDYKNFVVMDSVWDATSNINELGNITKPNGSITVTSTVGLLNMYEYQSSGNGKMDGYLNNGLNWWTLTLYNRASGMWAVSCEGSANSSNQINASGVRPAINLKSNIKVVDGAGTIDNPYRLEGDNDTDLSGTLLNTRYSGEYIRFGNDENNLYRIVCHETEGLTKITSAEPLKKYGAFIESVFGSNTTYSSTNTIGTFLNGEYLTNYVDSTYRNMIEESSTWYLGTVGNGTSYKLAKYKDTAGTSITLKVAETKVGLLRIGELMAGQFDRYVVKDGISSTGLTTHYWLITPYNSSNMRGVRNDGYVYYGNMTLARGVKPAINLKQNVIITDGLGTKEQPFEIELG